MLPCLISGRSIARVAFERFFSGRRTAGLAPDNQPVSLVRLGFAVRMLLLLFLNFATNLMGSPNVAISGGADDSGHNYSWTIKNEHDSPIIFVEFPQYKAGVGIPPHGWKSKLTNPRGLGGRTGFFTSQVDTAADGIAPGESATFGLTVTRSYLRCISRHSRRQATQVSSSDRRRDALTHHTRKSQVAGHRTSC